MEEFSKSNQVQEILDYQELYKLTKGTIKPISNNLKIDLSGLQISRENIQNFQLILKNIPKEITSLSVVQKDIILNKEIRADNTALLNLADLPQQLTKINYQIEFVENYTCINIEKYIEQIAKLPKFINEFQIIIQQKKQILFSISLENLELYIVIIANNIEQRYGLLKSSFKEIFEKFGDKFNELALSIRNNENDDYSEFCDIYEALQYLPKHLRCIEIENDISVNQESNQILVNSLKGISQSVQKIYLQQNGELNNQICQLQQFPNIKILTLKRNYDISEPSDFIFSLLKNDFIFNMTGSDLQENEISDAIPNLRQAFSSKQIKNIILKLKNVSALTINHWQQLLQQFEFLTTRLKSLVVSLVSNDDDDGFEAQINDFSQTLFSRIQNLPRKLESLKLKLTNINFTDNSFQIFSNNIRDLPGNLKYLKLKIGNFFQNNVNYDQLFQNIKQLPNSLIELHIFINHLNSAFDQAQNFKNCIGLFTKERKIQKFTIKTQTHFIVRDESDLKTLKVILNKVNDLNDIFNQFDDRNFYLEGVDKLQVNIYEVQRFPNGNECEYLGEQLKNISKQFQEVTIYIRSLYPFGQTLESLIMYFKLADQNYLRKLFQIQNNQLKVIFQQAEKSYFYDIKFLADLSLLNQDVFNELGKFLGTENNLYEKLTLKFDYTQINCVQKFKEIHKFIHHKLKEFQLSYQECQISDSQMPFQIQALGQSLQSSNIEKFVIDVRENHHIHNKFLTNVFSRVYLWESLKDLTLELSSTNLKSKGLNQFSKIIKGRLPNLESLDFNLCQTKSPYKLLSSSVVNLILAFNGDVCPKLEFLGLGIDQMKNKFLKKELKDIGLSIAKLSQSLKHIILNMVNMIEYQGKGIKNLIKSIASLSNLEKAELNFPSYDQNYQNSVFYMATKIPKYFRQNKLKHLQITFDIKTNTDLDQNKLLLNLIKCLKQIDLTKCFYDIYIYNMLIAIGGFKTANFSLESCNISKETYELFLKFLFDLPPSIELPKNLSLVPIYDYNQVIDSENSDDSDDSDDSEQLQFD
ncbi:hypothetical protein ABPG74_001266 [Tetrahymena malaccensis]